MRHSAKVLLRTINIIFYGRLNRYTKEEQYIVILFLTIYKNTRCNKTWDKGIQDAIGLESDWGEVNRKRQDSVCSIYWSGKGFWQIGMETSNDHLQEIWSRMEREKTNKGLVFKLEGESEN